MTNLPEEAIPLWKEFKEARVCPSIDDLEHRNKYIRFPTEWSTVENNLNTIMNNGPHVSADEAFDGTYHTNVIVTSEGMWCAQTQRFLTMSSLTN